MQYEIRAMSFAEILDMALRLVTNNFFLLVGLMAVANLPTGLAGSYMLPGVPQPGDQVSSTEAIELVGGAAGGFLIMLIVFSVLYPIALAATTYAIGELYRGREVGFGEALQYATSNMRSLMWTWMLMALLVLLGLLCLVVPGIYLAFALIAVWPIMVVEKLYGMEAIQRSRALMRGNLMRAFGVIVVAALIGAVLDSAADLALAGIPVLNVIGGPLVQSATAAYAAAAQMVLYFDVRSRKEAFDIEHLGEPVDLQGDAGRPGI